jgi:hypothetical protein
MLGTAMLLELWGHPALAREAAAPASAAAEPRGVEGYRLLHAGRGRSAGGRLAVVGVFDGPFIVELAPWVQGNIKRFSWDASIALVAAGDARWSGASVGNVHAGAWLQLGKRAAHALGVRATLPLAVGAAGSGFQAIGDGSHWGTVASEVVPAFGAALAYRGSVGVFGWQVHSGLRTPFDDGSPFDLGLIVSAAPEVADDWFVVGELEAISEPSPLHLRALARRAIGKRLAGELGLAAPVPGIGLDPSLQVLGQVRSTW